MLNLDLDSIQNHLKKKGIEAHIQKETQQLCVILKIAEQEFPLFVRIFDGNELLQLLAFLPCNIQKSTLNDTARLLHLLNKEIDIPGFGMDESAFLAFYRCMMPAKNNKIDTAFFDAFFNAVDVVCKTFAPVITAVAHGAITFQDVLQKAKENKPISE